MRHGVDTTCAVTPICASFSHTITTTQKPQQDVALDLPNTHMLESPYMTRSRVRTLAQLEVVEAATLAQEQVPVENAVPG